MFTTNNLQILPILHGLITQEADRLLNNSILIFGSQKYRLAEIEFYLHQEAIFNDGTTHRNPRQLTSNFWYFHRSSKNDILKPLNRIGLDLTCGNATEKIYGGILIRAIQNIEVENDYVYGTAQVVERILSELNVQISDIPKIEEQPVDINHFLSLVPSNLSQQVVFPCPRVGLGKNASAEDLAAPYRFLTFAHKEHRDKEKTIFNYLKENNWDLSLVKKEFQRKNI